MTALVFDLGGTHLRCGVVKDSKGLSHIEKKRIFSFLYGQQRAEIWKAIVADILDYAARASSIIDMAAPIVIAFPGPVEKPNVVRGAPTVVGGVTDFPDLCQDIEQQTGRCVYLLNDISAAAWRMSKISEYNRFMVVTVSSGIGSKVFDRAHPLGVLDNVSYAGEIGHGIVDTAEDAAICDCGGKGHLGGIASGRGIERYARKQASRNHDAFQNSICVTLYGATSDRITNEQHFVPAILAGDPWALNIFRTCTAPLARTLLTVTLAIGLEKIYIIGGFALALGETYINILRELICAQNDYPLTAGSLADLIQLGVAGEETCLEGAAVFAERILSS